MVRKEPHVISGEAASRWANAYVRGDKTPMGEFMQGVFLEEGYAPREIYVIEEEMDSGQPSRVRVIDLRKSRGCRQSPREIFCYPEPK